MVSKSILFYSIYVYVFKSHNYLCQSTKLYGVHNLSFTLKYLFLKMIILGTDKVKQAWPGAVMVDQGGPLGEHADNVRKTHN